jgi:lipoprotein signal peptidase
MWTFRWAKNDDAMNVDVAKRVDAVHASVPIVGAVLLADEITKLGAPYFHSSLISPVFNTDYNLGILGGPAITLAAGSLLVLMVFVRLVAPRVIRLGVSPAIPALIVAGTLGNVFDRLRFGAVRDWLVTPWATINLADLAVLAGLVLLIGSVAIHLHELHQGSRRLLR